MKTKIKVNLCVFIVCVMSLVLLMSNAVVKLQEQNLSGIIDTITTNDLIEKHDDSKYLFVATSDTECSVRLVDKQIDKAIIPEKAQIDGKEYLVTSIAGNGFASASNLVKVRLPRSIKVIGNSAFANCKNLKSITLNEVESIGTNAFNLCISLPYLILPNSIQTLAPTILRNCNTKVYVRITQPQAEEKNWALNWNELNANQDVEYDSNYTPEVEYVEVYSAYYSKNRTNDIIGYYVADDQPFREQRDDKVYVYIPEFYNGQPVVGISDSAFIYNSIDYLIIGYANTPIHIDSYAFNGLECETITINRDIDINTHDWQGNLMLSEYLFADSSVSTILLPNSIDSLGNYMFNGCSQLKDVGFIEPQFYADKNIEENLAKNYISTNIINLPNSIVQIGTEVFSGIHLVNELNIPKSVINVGEAILVGWKEPQKVKIDYEKESDLIWDSSNNVGWNPNWKNNCDNNIIEFTGEYKIEYVLNGGEHSGNPDKYSSKDIIMLNDATRLGYIFDGWYLDSDCNKDKIKEISKGSSGDMVLYAKWVPISYKIMYDPNKPNIATSNVIGNMTESQHYFDFDSQLSSNKYMLKGWTFIGWNTSPDASGVKYEDDSSIMNLTFINGESVKLYAQWKQNSYHINYYNNKPNNASSLLIGDMATTTLFYDEIKSIDKNNFSLLGWQFVGWNTNADGSGDSYEDGQQIINLTHLNDMKITLFAQWTPIEYKIIYMSNKPSNASQSLIGIMKDSLFTYDNETNLARNNYLLTGWTFIGWNTEADGTGISYNNSETIRNLTSTNHETILLYAQWNANNYNIIYDKNKPLDSSSEIAGNMGVSKFKYDETGFLTDNNYIMPGWKFVGWNTRLDGTGDLYKINAEIFNLSYVNNAEIILYALWSKNTYSINYNSNRPSVAKGDLNGTMQNSFATYEEYITLNDNKYQLNGWNFDCWNTKADGSGVSYENLKQVRNITVNDEITLYAQWTPNKYRIVYNSNKPNSSSQDIKGFMNESLFEFDYLHNLPCNNYTMKGYSFVGWSKSAEGNIDYYNEGNIIIDGNQNEVINLYAKWEINEYKITLFYSHHNFSSVYGNYTVEQELKFTIDDKYDFGYTYSDNEIFIPRGSTGDKQFTITVTPIKYTLEIEFIGDGGKELESKYTKVLEYDEKFTYTAPDITGYVFSHFAHLKDNYIAPPLLPGQTVDPNDIFDIYKDKTTTFTKLCYEQGAVYNLRAIYNLPPTEPEIKPAPSCVAEETMITLADGSKKAVEELTGNEMLLVWNMMTGKFDVAPILFIDKDARTTYEVINLYFSDGTNVKVISEHAFWDFDLNEYVFLRNDAAKYIGHWFNKQIMDSNGNMTWTKVQLTNVEVKEEITKAYSPVTYSHLCYYVNGMLSMPGATEGLINIFEVDRETMKINEEVMKADIEKYGLYTYVEFAEIMPIPEEVFNAFNGQYLKVSIGKGLITIDKLISLFNTYIDFLAK